METRDSDAETYETIPWAHLAPDGPPRSTRVATVVVGILVAAVVAYVLVTLLRPAPGGVVVDLSGAEAARTSTGAPPATPEPAAPDPALPDPALPDPALPDPATPDLTAASIDGPASRGPTTSDETPGGLYSEADLMAIAPEEEMRAATALAEWFVVDFFTVDGDPASGDAVRDALPLGVDVALPHDDPAGVSYVEWARAIAVHADDPRAYVVDVAFRTLAGRPGSDLRRMAVRVVRMPIRFDDEGLPFVADLPQAIALAVGRGAFTIPSPAEPPAEVAGAATAAVATIGTPGPLTHSGLGGDGWRIVVDVTDDSGLTWPVVARP